MKKKIMITTGGTGGHIFPAIGLAQDLKKQDVDTLFLGDKFSENFDFPYELISSSTISWKKPSTIWKNLKGIKQSYKAIKKFRPDVVIGFGSFYSFPTLASAVYLKIPIILHEANALMGQANHFFSKYALFTATNFPNIPGKYVGMPFRHQLPKNPIKAWEYFQLDPSKKTVLIFGGSQGAYALNKKASEVISDCQVLHFTGSCDMTAELKQKYSKRGISACVKDFEPLMNYAWGIADFAISRAGAGTISESIEYEVPAILVPYPFAKNHHQDINAEYFQHRIKGGLLVQQDQLNSAHFDEMIKSLEQKRENIQKYKRNYPKQNFAKLILENI